ncbi:MAG: hypothetical protein E6772_15540 [Dysgonomonas sp.]|nr:hypothetical protein [Dysgonomonas sp.]
MKRFFILVAVVAAFSTTTFASNNEYNLLSGLNETEKVNALSNYLGATSEQKEYLKEIFARSAQKAGTATTEGEISDAKVKKAMAFNLANAKSVLTPEQYKKYLIILNMTLNNK